MPIEKLPSLLLLILAVGYSPGPANIFSLMCSMRHGHKAAMKMWVGLFAGFVVAAVTLAFFTHLIGEAMRDYIAYVKYAGAAYILYLAWQTFSPGEDHHSHSRSCSFVSGMVMQLTNAKILLFELTVYSSFVLPYSREFTDLLAVGALMLLAGPGANLFWLFLGGFMHRIFARYQRNTEIAMALCLVACAGFIALS